ncbi:MAG: hypothetical protein DME62_13790 [Verrucomicrobia bacterium]|nr:MAG: hypothetical protein DME62_13790 [Verrucomicrobiota bacterium]
MIAELKTLAAPGGLAWIWWGVRTNFTKPISVGIQEAKGERQPSSAGNDSNQIVFRRAEFNAAEHSPCDSGKEKQNAGHR